MERAKHSGTQYRNVNRSVSTVFDSVLITSLSTYSHIQSHFVGFVFRFAVRRRLDLKNGFFTCFVFVQQNIFIKSKFEATTVPRMLLVEREPLNVAK